jgi:hypothetical protein
LHSALTRRFRGQLSSDDSTSARDLRVLRIVQPIPETASQKRGRRGQNYAGLIAIQEPPNDGGECCQPDAAESGARCVKGRGFAPADATRPERFFLCASCFSTRVAEAGKIAGKGKKRPPVSGP